jgi:hypothetical protein
MSSVAAARWSKVCAVFETLPLRGGGKGVGVAEHDLVAGGALRLCMKKIGAHRARI